MTRQELTAEAERIGQALNALREAANQSRAPFVAGIIRAAEESVLVAYTMLKDAPDQEL